MRLHALRERAQLLASGWKALACHAFGPHARAQLSQVVNGPVRQGHALFRRFQLQLSHAVPPGADLCRRAFVAWRTAWAKMASQAEVLRSLFAARAGRPVPLDPRPAFAAWAREVDVAREWREEARCMGGAADTLREVLEVFGRVRSLPRP